MRIAGGVDSAGVGIKEEEVVPPAEDEGGFFPALRKRKGARCGDLNLLVGLGFRGGLALLRFWPRLGSGEKLRRVFGVRGVVHLPIRLKLADDFVTLRSSDLRFLGILGVGFMGFLVCFLYL